MQLRQLSADEIKCFSERPGVRKIAVENFLMTMGDSYVQAVANLLLDASLYGWGDETFWAILYGILFAVEERAEQKSL